MTTIAVIGAAGVVAQAVLPRLEDVGTRLIGVDVRDPLRWWHRADFHRVDVAGTDLKPILDGVDVLVDLGGVSDPVPDEAMMRRVNIEGTRHVLEAAAAVDVHKIVRMSTVAVYGAWANNPVPLTEDSPMRPVPGFTPATHAAEIERLLLEWRDAHPGRVVTVLRTAMVGGPGIDHLAARLLAGLPPLVVKDAAPLIQAVHLDDVASAVALAVERDLDGVYNVAADGWLTDEEARELARHRLRIPLPGQLAERVLRVTWPTGLVDLPPSGLAHLVHPPVVANDKLRAAGWVPRFTNDEAVLAAIDAEEPLVARAWRYAALATVGSVVAAAAAAVTAAWAVGKWRRVRRAVRHTRG